MAGNINQQSYFDDMMNSSVEQNTIKGFGGGAIQAMRDSVGMESLTSSKFNAKKKKKGSKGKVSKGNKRN